MAVELELGQFQPFFLARKKFYAFLHFLFVEPTSSVPFLEIQKFGNIDELEKIHEGGAILHSFFREFTIESLAIERKEYQRLFTGPGKMEAPPWESFYRNKDQLLFDECCFEVRQHYHRNGLQFQRENNEPDDHLLLELEFMCFLCDRSLKETDKALLLKILENQIYFLEEHLRMWIPQFCTRILENTSSKLYKGAALLLDNFLLDDLHSLKELMEAVEHV